MVRSVAFCLQSERNLTCPTCCGSWSRSPINARGDAAPCHHQDLIAEGLGLFTIVSYIQHWQAELVADAAQVGDDFVLQGGVQVCQGFIQQQQARRGQQGSGQGDSLLFTAG